MLEISDPSMAVKPLDEDEKGTKTIGTPGGPQKVLTVSEPGLYRLIFQSRKPGAEAFQRWVTHDVLPAIRKTGGYGKSTDQLAALASGAQKRKDAAKNAQDWIENTKQKALLAKIHERIGNRRSDFAHKRSRELVNRYQVIVFEDLEPQQMGARRGRGMRKSIMDVAWSQFISMTIGKAAEAGRIVILIDPRNTSKMCPHCGELVQKTLSDRTHTCPNCGLVMDRDVNAALNILQRGLQTLRL